MVMQRQAWIRFWDKSVAKSKDCGLTQDMVQLNVFKSDF